MKWTKDNQFICWEVLRITSYPVGNINQDVRINILASVIFLALETFSDRWVHDQVTETQAHTRILPWDIHLGLSTIKKMKEDKQ